MLGLDQPHGVLALTTAQWAIEDNEVRTAGFWNDLSLEVGHLFVDPEVKVFG